MVKNEALAMLKKKLKNFLLASKSTPSFIQVADES